MSEVKSLRAAELGYTWDPRLPDGTTWTREKSGTRYLSRKVPEPFSDGWMCGGEWVSEFSIALKLLSVEPPDFGDRPWQQCILIKGQEPPELPPCPPGDGWIEWSGGECPVLSGCLVFLQFRGGGLSGDWKPAGGWCWSHDGSQADIIRYRVRQPKYRPYTDEEMSQLVGKVLRHKSGTVALVGSYDPRRRSVRMLVYTLCEWTPGGLLAEWRVMDGTPDGSPCGVEVTNG